MDPRRSRPSETGGPGTRPTRAGPPGADPPEPPAGPSSALATRIDVDGELDVDLEIDEDFLQRIRDI